MRVRGADGGAAGDDDVAHQLDAVAERDVAADHAEGTDLHALAEPGARPRRSPSAWHLSHFGIACADLRIDQRADLGLGHDLAVHLGLAVEAPGAAAAADLAHMVVQLVAGQHRLAELGAVDPHEIDELRLVGRSSKLCTHSAPAVCASPSMISTPGMIGNCGKVPLEERLVDGDALDADGALVAIHVDDAVDQQKRIAVRQQLHARARCPRVPSFFARLPVSVHVPCPLQLLAFSPASISALASLRRSARPCACQAA